MPDWRKVQGKEICIVFHWQQSNLLNLAQTNAAPQKSPVSEPELYKTLHQRETYLSLPVSFLSLALKCARQEEKHAGRRKGGRYLVCFFTNFLLLHRGGGNDFEKSLVFACYNSCDNLFSALAESTWIPRSKCVTFTERKREGWKNTCRRGSTVSAPVWAPPQLAQRGWICIDLVTGESGQALIWEVLLQSSTLIAQGGSGVVNRCQDGERGETARLRQQIDAL